MVIEITLGKQRTQQESHRNHQKQAEKAYKAPYNLLTLSFKVLPVHDEDTQAASFFDG